MIETAIGIGLTLGLNDVTAAELHVCLLLTNTRTRIENERQAAELAKRRAEGVQLGHGG